MIDLISRQAAMNAFAERVKRSNNSDFAPAPRWNDAVEIVENLPSAEPTLYGYKIEHLAYIARVMEKEGITAASFTCSGFTMPKHSARNRSARPQTEAGMGRGSSRCNASPARVKPRIIQN